MAEAYIPCQHLREGGKWDRIGRVQLARQKRSRSTEERWGLLHANCCAPLEQKLLVRLFIHSSLPLPSLQCSCHVTSLYHSGQQAFSPGTFFLFILCHHFVKRKCLPRFPGGCCWAFCGAKKPPYFGDAAEMHPSLISPSVLGF